MVTLRSSLHWKIFRRAGYNPERLDLAWRIIVLGAQLLTLALIPLLSGIVPGSGMAPVDLPALLGIIKPVSRDFMVGTWKYADYFSRWGVADKKKARIETVRADAFMSLREDGTVKMINLFRPVEGRWELSDRGIIIYDPQHPERGSQLLPVRKRDEDRIWLLLPFTGGANGIGMVRVQDQEITPAEEKREPAPRRKFSVRSGSREADWTSDPAQLEKFSKQFPIQE